MTRAADSAGKAYMPVVGRLLAGMGARRNLDAPSGSGWLARLAGAAAILGGIDLYAAAPEGYRNVQVHDLNSGLPGTVKTGDYDALVSCEGLEHVSNSLLLLSDAWQGLRPGGLIVVTTPNTWNPAAKLKYLTRGFFPGSPSLVGRIQPGTHMHVVPWNYARLHLHLTLAGFDSISIHEVAGPQPKHALEWLLAWPSWLYCRHRFRSHRGEVERLFWRAAGSQASLFGRRLVVSGRKPGEGALSHPPMHQREDRSA